MKKRLISAIIAIYFSLNKKNHFSRARTDTQLLTWCSRCQVRSARKSELKQKLRRKRLILGKSRAIKTWYPTWQNMFRPRKTRQQQTSIRLRMTSSSIESPTHSTCRTRGPSPLHRLSQVASTIWQNRMISSRVHRKHKIRLNHPLLWRTRDAKSHFLPSMAVRQSPWSILLNRNPTIQVLRRGLAKGMKFQAAWSCLKQTKRRKSWLTKSPMASKYTSMMWMRTTSSMKWKDLEVKCKTSSWIKMSRCRRKCSRMIIVSASTKPRSICSTTVKTGHSKWCLKIGVSAGNYAHCPKMHRHYPRHPLLSWNQIRVTARAII